MSRILIIVLTISVFTTMLVTLTLGYEAWRQRRLARRAVSARRMGLEDEALRATLDRPALHGAALWLRTRLDQAGDPRTAQQFVLETAGLAACGLLVTVLFLHGPLKLAGLLLGGIPILLLRRRASIRSKMITEQLPDAFDRIERTLRTGHAFSDALRLASEEMPAPLSEELARVVSLQALGVDLRGSLETLAARNPTNFDIRLFVGAVLLNRETGGNLVEILDHLAETVRERLIFDGKVLALTAEVRLSALILGALPFVVSGALLAIKPTYLAPLLGSDGGREMLLVGVVSLLIGAVLMRRLAAVEG